MSRLYHGSAGLGIFIAQTIAERMGAEVMPAYVDERTRTGLRVRVLFPTGEGAAVSRTH